MASTVTYNGSTLTYPSIVRWDQEPVYDEARTTVFYVRHNVEISFIITGTSEALFQTAMWTLRHNLAEPRKPLLVDAGTGSDDHYVDITDLATPQRLPDFEGGPKPGTLRIDRVQGELMARGSWSVAFTYQHGGSAGAEESGFNQKIIQKSFTCNYAFDVQGVQTRTFVGTAKLRDVDSHQTVLTANRLRGLIPPLPRAFRRTACNIFLSGNGLEVKVETIDQEITADWIAGVAEVVEATYTEGQSHINPRTGGGIPFLFTKRMNLTLRGAKGTTRDKLVDIINLIVMNKFTFIDYEQEVGDEEHHQHWGKDWPIEITWHENLVDNLVGVAVTAIYLPDPEFRWSLPSSAKEHLTDSFGKRLPADVTASIRAGAANHSDGSIDYATHNENRVDRLGYVTPVQRIILSSLLTGAVKVSTPNQLDGAPDDFGGTGFVPNMMVDSYYDDWETIVPIGGTGPRPAVARLAHTAGITPGGYIEDDEIVRIEFDNSRVSFPAVGLAYTPAREEVMYQWSSPQLRIFQTGKARRVGKAPIPRPPIQLVDPNTTLKKAIVKAIVEPMGKYHLGPTQVFAVRWHWEIVYPAGAETVTMDDQKFYTRAIQNLSARASRVSSADIEALENPIFRYSSEGEYTTAGGSGGGTS